MSDDRKNTHMGQDFEAARDRWRDGYDKQLPNDKVRRNRSGIEVKPLYTPEDWSGDAYLPDLGFPGDAPFTRGIYPTMHRGRSWTQRQLIGLATPEDYNARMRRIVDSGATALSMIPCNSVYRGYDIDEVDIEIVGTCGTTINTVGDVSGRRADRRYVDCAERSVAVHIVGVFAGHSKASECVVGSDFRDLEPKRLHLALCCQPYVLPFSARRFQARIYRSRGICQRTVADVEPGLGGRPTYAAVGRDAC